jgi:putative ABC transport system permease protein
VKPLTRKLVRDLWRLRWQVLAIGLLIACGVAVAVMAFSAQKALEQAKDRFYAETRFADVFAVARRAPISVARALEAVEGVTAVDPRMTEAGLMQVPGLSRPATARVISLPIDDRHALNRLRLVRGRMPDPASTGEVVALKTFLDAAKVGLGDRLTAVIHGRAFSFVIVGAVMSPEYVYVPSPESFMPDDAHQAVFWAPRPAVEKLTGQGGAFNAVALKLAPGAPEGAALMAVDRILAPYGGRAAAGRADQVSNAFLDAELKELSTSASILPPVFLIVAAALVHMVVARMVEAEREQIGLLKAFGYRDFEAASGYLWLAAAIGGVGAAGGGLLGAGLSALLVGRYGEYFRLPTLAPGFQWTAFLASSLAAVGAAGAGSALAVRRAAALSPAVAMQPLRPASYRKGLLDAVLTGPAVDEPLRMVVRNIERFPGRAALTALGLAASLALVIGTQFMFGSIERVIDHAFYRAQRWGEQVGFAETRGPGAVAEAARLPGVIAAEPVRVVGARAKAAGREERVRIVGLEPDALMSRPLDRAGRPIGLLGRGLVLSEALAARLQIRPGDEVRIEVLEGRAPVASLPVVALAEDYSGFSIYMQRRALNRLMGEGDLASGAQLLLAPDFRPAFYAAVARIPQIAAASSRDDTVAGWRLAMTEAFRVSILFYVGFAAAIAFGVAYNSCRIALSERARDLATLRVLGFRRRDCAFILAGELFVLALAALPLGVVGGQALAKGLVVAYARDELRLPAAIAPASYATSLTVYAAVIAVAAVLVTRRIWSLDLVAVLKTRE